MRRQRLKRDGAFAPETWVPSARRPYLGFPFAGICVIRGQNGPLSTPPSAPRVRFPFCFPFAGIFRHSRVQKPRKPLRLPSNDSLRARYLYALPRSLPLVSPFGLPSAGYPASARWHVFPPPRPCESPSSRQTARSRLNFGSARRSDPTLVFHSRGFRHSRAPSAFRVCSARDIFMRCLRGSRLFGCCRADRGNSSADFADGPDGKAR
jgi:hypothetical protein